MGRLAVATLLVAFLGLVGARFLGYPAWLYALYACVFFAGLGVAFITGFLLSRMQGSPWATKASVLAMTLAVAAALRSIADPLGVPAGEQLANLGASASGPLSAAAAIAAVVIGYAGLGSTNKAGRYVAIASWALAGAAIGSLLEFLRTPIGPRTAAVVFLFAAVFISALSHDEPHATEAPPQTNTPGASGS